jgi:hypothetical protein
VLHVRLYFHPWFDHRKNICWTLFVLQYFPFLSFLVFLKSIILSWSINQHILWEHIGLKNACIPLHYSCTGENHAGC